MSNAIEEPRIIAISDSLGETAEHVSKAAASQFVNTDFVVIKKSNIKTKEQLKKIIEKNRHYRCVIFYTLVQEELRIVLIEEAQKYNIPCVDILGPPMAVMEKVLGKPPRRRPGILRQLDKSYFQKIEALEFAVKHDDGRNLDTLHKAELVLIGVSRTSKTPLSMYLAYKGWKVANIPIIYQMEMPAELSRIPKNIIVGLTTDIKVLESVRQKRMAELGSRTINYASIEEITKELRYAESTMARLGYRIINTANKAIEELANEVIKPFIQGGDDYGQE